ncbi:DICT sensory domain-containing protein [Halobacteriales archaeon Cl-PHB]
MHLEAFVDDVAAADQTLTVYNRERPRPVQNLLEKTFGGDLAVREASGDPGAPADLLALQDEEGYVVATSRLEAVQNSLLMVNSDLYITGTRSLDQIETPEVVAAMDDTTFSVANRRKFLLIHISRHVESLALGTDGGTLHTGFQDLSRIHDECGTTRAYRRLADSGVDVHVYGAPDWPEAPEMDLTVHAEPSGEIPRSWFVVHDGAGEDARKAALVAVATGPNEYRGFWTFQPALVDDVCAYLERTYGE